MHYPTDRIAHTTTLVTGWATGVTKDVVSAILSVHIKVHIKEPLLLIRKSSLHVYGSSGFPIALSEWFFTICLTPYNRK